jgi:hypothetical protein
MARRSLDEQRVALPGRMTGGACCRPAAGEGFLRVPSLAVPDGLAGTNWATAYAWAYAAAVEQVAGDDRRRRRQGHVALGLN